MSRRKHQRVPARNQEVFIESLLTDYDWDEIDEAAADPPMDRLPRRKTEEVKNVLNILDQLQPGGQAK